MPVTHIGNLDIDVNALTPFEGNPRRGAVNEIAESIRSSGQYRSIVVRREGERLTILAGNHTWRAARQVGLASIRCDIIECDDVEAKRIVAADNRLGQLGGYDTDALLSLLGDLPDLTGTGYTDDAVAAILAGTTPDLPPGYGDQDPFDSIGDADSSDGSLDGRDRQRENPLGTPVVSYQIVFDNDAQQATFHAYLRWLRTRYTHVETIGARIAEHLSAEVLGGE